jgi:hypothetical protein
LQRAGGIRPPALPALPSPPASDPAPSKQNSSSNPGWSGEGLEGLFYLAGAIVASPFIVPHWAVDDDIHCDGSFLHFPYENDWGGYMWVDQSSLPRPDGAGNLALRLSAEDGNDFHGLNRTGGRLFVDTNGRLGLQVRGDWYRERLPEGQSDVLFLGSTEVTFRFAQSERLQFFAGLGARMSENDLRSRFGVNFTYGADIYPINPLVVSLSLDVGNLGSDLVFNAHATAGVLYKHVELFAGYDYLLIGPVDLQGALAGIRLWF